MLFVLRNSNAVIFDVEFYVHFRRVDSAVHDDVYDPSSFGFFLRRGVFNRVVDNIHQALANAERNKSLNSSNVNFFHSDTYVQKKDYDLTVANILLNTIIQLKEKLISSLKPGGTLILSGILEDQASSIIDTFRDEMVISIIDQNEGWLLMKGQK